MMQKFRTKPRELAGEKIECYIAEHQLKAHDKLPSERDMCEMWDFNRTTLRSALATLISDGKLYNKKGSGTFVAPPKLVRHLQELKSLGQFAKESGRTLTTEVLYICKIESPKRIAQSLCLTIGHPVWELARLRALDGENIILETSYIDAEKYSELDQHDLAKESLYKVLESYGAKLASGHEKIGITTATEEEAELLGVEAESPLFYLTGEVFDQDGVPVECFKSLERPDKVRFSGKLIR